MIPDLGFPELKGEGGGLAPLVRPKLMSRPILISGTDLKLPKPSSLATDLEEDILFPPRIPGPTLLELEIVIRVSLRVRDVAGGGFDGLGRLVDLDLVPEVLLRSWRLLDVGGGRLPVRDPLARVMEPLVDAAPRLAVLLERSLVFELLARLEERPLE